MGKGEAIDKIIVFLARSEHRDDEHDFYKVAEQLNIDKSLATMCFNTMFHSRKFIAGPPALGNPVIRLTPIGLKYAEELETNHYKITGNLLFSKYAKPLPLPEVCEILFQMHKNDEFAVIWTKETYKEKPKNLKVAKEILVQQKIIYSKSYTGSSPVETTHLNPDLFFVESYEDAKKVLKGELLNSSNSSSGNFSVEEQNEVSSKIDEALRKLNELGIAQEIIFEEFEELKKHLSLSKKNWSQLLKGKLLDLLGKEVLSKKTAIAMYEIISQSIKADRLILP